MNIDHDELLAELLESCLQRVRAGQPADLESVIVRHPQLATDLRELWAAAVLAEEFAIGDDTLDGPFASACEPTTVRVPLHESHLPRPFGDYLLLEELGRGGMGVVYRAHQQSLDRTVALKMILRNDLASSVDVARFRAEAESAARLQHPHIVPVYEVGEIDRQPYFSMQLIEGTTLARHLFAGPLPGPAAAELLLPVCQAIAAAHRGGVLHRDLKPSNILIDEAGRPYVSDFGLAKRVSTSSVENRQMAALTQTGAILGTPEYMAPEQAAGNRGEIGTATDVYSLGTMLYAMLTGRPPFQSASPVDTVLMVLEQEPLPPRLINPQADPDLEMIVLKCLQKPADLRYPTADALTADLRAYLANEPIAARSSQFTQILTRAFRETHHAVVLENWGLLWIWHSLVLLVLCLLTNLMQWQEVTSRLPYLGMWTVGLSAWAAIFWRIRRRAGPITFVERQIAHVWAGSMIASTLLYGVEWILELPVLALSPVLPLITGTVFLVKAGVLSGRFYLEAAAIYLTALLMAGIRHSDLPDFGLAVFGVVSAATFFFPGLKYYRQSRRTAGKKGS